MGDRPVVLVHGFSSSFERNWREPGWVDVLREEGHEVIGVDLLGHGSAPKPTDPAAYADLESGIAAAIPEGTQVDAVGFSLGSRLLLRLAAREPERFARIVVGGVGDGIFAVNDGEVTARAVESGERGDGDHPSAGAFARFAQAPGNDPAALAACLRRPQEPVTAEEMGRVTVPVMVVLGDRDFSGPADRLVAALPDARLVTLAGADHFGTPQDFRFVEAVVKFLAG